MIILGICICDDLKCTDVVNKLMLTSFFFTCFLASFTQNALLNELELSQNNVKYPLSVEHVQLIMSDLCYSYC